jgi:protein TonB
MLFLLLFVCMKPAINTKQAVYTIDFIGASSKPMRYGAPEGNGAAQQQQPAAAKPSDESIKTAAPPPQQPAKKEPAKPAYNSKEQIAKNAKKNPKKDAPAKKEPAKPAKEEKVVLSKPSILGDIDSSNIDPSALHSLSGGGEGGNNVVRASFTNFPYPWYITQVRNALWREWSKRMPRKTGLSTLVSFTIDRHGAIYGVQIEQSSGNESYDYAAMSAAGNSAPYPPLPAGFERDILTVTVEFKNEE